MPIDDESFETMLARARRFSRRLDELGISRSVIEAHVCVRLQSKPQRVVLAPGETELADEILELLENPRLSPWQAHELQQAVLVN